MTNHQPHSPDSAANGPAFSTGKLVLVSAIIAASMGAGIYIAIAAPAGTAARVQVDGVMMLLMGIAGMVKFASLTGIFAIRVMQESTQRLRNLYFLVCFALLTVFLGGIALAGVGELL